MHKILFTITYGTLVFTVHLSEEGDSIFVEGEKNLEVQDWVDKQGLGLSKDSFMDLKKKLMEAFRLECYLVELEVLLFSDWMRLMDFTTQDDMEKGLMKLIVGS